MLACLDLGHLVGVGVQVWVGLLALVQPGWSSGGDDADAGGVGALE